MSSVLYLAICYLRHHRLKTALMVAAVTLVFLVPASLTVLATLGEAHLKARAAATPILVGPKGSPLELSLNSLYFRSKVTGLCTFGEVGKIFDSNLVLPIPLYVRYRSQGDPIVGTSLDYFDYRQLKVAQGRLFSRLGDCVAGAHVASRRSLIRGASVVSTPEHTFDVTGTAPLKMRVTGILEPTGTPDDDALFVDVKTTWIIEGLGHGHRGLEKTTIESKALPPVAQYNEITDANVDSFHFHGDMDTFPITAILISAPDDRSSTRLIGRYQAPNSTWQAIEPPKVMDELLATVFTVRAYALAASIVVLVVTLGLIAVIEMLSLRLRKREREVLMQIGGSRGRVFAVMASEGVAVLFVGMVIAAGLTLLLTRYASVFVQHWARS